MASLIQHPVILVVDDVEEYRERLLPAMVEMLGGKALKAGNVEQAARKAAEHGPKSPEPLDLVIVDMHMPFGDHKPTDLMDNAGIQCLQVITQFKLLRCPRVVFTAYPSFADCVASVEAGADAYIPKARQGAEGGPDALRQKCEELLRSPQEKREAIPTRAWIEKHREWLTSQYNGKWVAFVPKDEVEAPAVLNQPEREGVILLEGASYEEVRAKVLAFPCVLRSLPAILMVQGKR